MKRFIAIICCVFLPFLYAGNYYVISDAMLDDVFRNEIIYEKNPSSNEAKFNLAMAYAYTGQIKRGWDILQTVPKEYAQIVLDTYEPLLEENEDWMPPFKCGFGYYFVKEKSKAVDVFQMAYERNPENVWSLGFKALVLGDQGKIDEAISVCKKAIKQEKNAVGIHFLLAEGYRKKGDYLKFLSQLLLVGRLQTAESNYERKNEEKWKKRKDELRQEMMINDSNSIL